MIRKSFTFEGRRYFVRGETEAEAVEVMTRLKVALEEGRLVINRNTTYSQWFEEWLTTYKTPSVSVSWAQTIKDIGRAVIVPEIGNQRLKDIKPVHIQRILNSKADMSASYIRLIYVIIADSLRIAQKNGLIRENPCDPVTIPKGRKQQSRRAITAKERKYILQTCEKHRAGLFYLIMLYCGLRPGEVAALQWRNVDLKNRVLTVDSAVKSDGSIGQPKSSAGNRRVPIPEALMEKLNPGSPWDFVCTNASGGMLTKSAMKQQWKSFHRQLNIEMGCRTFKGQLIPPHPVADDLVPYCLRHTYCTDLQAAGVPINVARELMGHSDISITSRIYTHSSVESFSDAADMINALYERKRANVDNCSVIEQLP